MSDPDDKPPPKVLSGMFWLMMAFCVVSFAAAVGLMWWVRR